MKIITSRNQYGKFFDLLIFGYTLRLLSVWNGLKLPRGSIIHNDQILNYLRSANHRHTFTVVIGELTIIGPFAKDAIRYLKQRLPPGVQTEAVETPLTVKDIFRGLFRGKL